MVNEENIKFVAADVFGCSVDNIRVRPKFWSVAKPLDSNEHTVEIGLNNEDVLYYIVSLDFYFVQGRLNFIDVEGNVFSSITNVDSIQHLENALLKNVYFSRGGSAFGVYAQAMYYEVTRF